MAEQQTYHGIFLAESDGEPIALFKFADQAQQIRKTFYGNNGAVAPVDLAVPRHDEMADLLADRPVAAPGSASSPGEEQLRAEIRAELVQQRTRERLKREIEQELEAEERGEKTVELREPAVPPVADPERDAGGGVLDPGAPSDVQPGEVADPDAFRAAQERGEIVTLSGDGSGEALPPFDPTVEREMPGDPLNAVTEEQAAALKAAGYDTADKIRAASDSDLEKVPGIGPAAVKRLREATKA